MPLALVQAMNGLWATLAPRSFYGDFPFGRGWVEALPAYNEHLMRDVGGLFVMSAIVLGAAAWWLERRLVAVSLVAWLGFAIPHTAYHLANLGPYSTGDAVANVVTLAATVLLPLLLLALLWRPPGRAGEARRGQAALAEERPAGGPDAGGAADPGPGSPGRIRGAPAGGNLFTRLAYRSSRRRFGKVMDPLTLFAHQPRLLAGYGALEMATEHSRRLDARSKHLAEMRAGMLAGCEWCLDFGSALSAEAGVEEDDLRELATYATSERFSEAEKLALELASGMSRTPVDVPEELFAKLRGHFDEAQLVELVSVIALENYRARFNWAFGLEGQGFAEGSYCVRPAGDGSATNG